MSRGGFAAATGLTVMAAIALVLILRAENWSAPLDEAAAAAGRDVYLTGIFEDVTARNFWARFGPDNTIWNTYVAADLHPTLFGYATKTFAWVPRLAVDAPTPLQRDDADQLWRSTVRLQQGHVWSDGTPVTAHDVAFTFRAIAALGANRLGGNFPSIAPEDLVARVEARDDETVEFFLTRSDGRYRFGMLTAPILQRGFWEPHLARALATANPQQAMFDVDIVDEPVYGSFLMGTWERGSFINRPANRRYSGRGSREDIYPNGAVRLTDGEYEWTTARAPEGEPEIEVVTGPHVDAIHYRVYGNQAAGVLALQAGQVHFLFNSIGLEKGFQTQLRGVPGVTLVDNPSNGMRYLAFNMRRAPMDRQAFRQAVATLIDREFITERVLQGIAYPLYSVVPPANTFWHNPDVTRYGHGMSRADRIRAAVQLLEADGFSWAQKPVLDDAGNLVRPGRGLRLPGGAPLRELELLGPGEAYDPLRATFASWTGRWLTEVGIAVRNNLTSFNVVADRVTDTRDFDMFILGWSLTIYPAYLNNFFHSRYTALRQLNRQGYSSPEYDRLVEEFLGEADDLERARTLAFRLQEMLARDVPYVVLFDTPIVEAYRSDRIRFPTTEGIGGIQGMNLRDRAGFLHAVQLDR